MSPRHHVTASRPSPSHLVTLSLLALLAVVFLAPFAWMVSTAIKADHQLFTSPPRWIPSPFQWDNFGKALSAFPFVRYLINTLVVCTLVVIGTVASSALPAYGFARLRWRGRDWMFFLVLATLMLPSQVTLLPTFLLFRWLGWTDTFAPLTVPAFFGHAFSIFLLRQFFLTIPNELSDAARLDGCTELGIFTRVIVPLSRPALATVALFAFTGAWMDFMSPLVYLSDDNNYTLALGLFSFLGRHAQQWNLLMAAATVMTLPMVLLFLLAQRAFIEGIAITGMKG